MPLLTQEAGAPVDRWSVPLQCPSPKVGYGILSCMCSLWAETQSHIQRLCPALKDAHIRAHHNLAQRLWKGISDAFKQCHICVEQTVDGLRGLQQPEEQIQEWQLVWDELTDVQQEVQEGDTEGGIQRKQPDALTCNKKCRKETLKGGYSVNCQMNGQ